MMLGKLLSDLLTRATGNAPAETEKFIPPVQRENPTKKIIITKREPPKTGGHTDAFEILPMEPTPKKLPNKLLTELGYPCPVDGNPLPHIHDIEWFRYPGIDEPLPHIILWKADA
jgi:hypothetical protein